ncbi:MAG: carboxynorspermidine decarboxylase, partial [Micavibrio sp.]|nr:carboxynorspermidine decarboxylase [Micavibrio sp.]
MTAFAILSKAKNLYYGEATMNNLLTIPAPAYVADIAAIKRNMGIAARIREEAGVKILLATKAFAMPAVFPFMKDYLDGTTASGLYEARLGATHFGKEVHTYSPAFTEKDLLNCLEYSNHIYFNSVSQLMRFAPIVRTKKPDIKIGLRVNPGLSLVKNSELYDPSSPTSRFGIQPDELTDNVLQQIDILHVHNLCENMAKDSLSLITHIAKIMPQALHKISSVNLGGGHYYSHPDYDVPSLITALKNMKETFNVNITLEPGGAHIYDAGYLIGEVMDVFENANKQAILSVSASTHMPDVLEVPYRPNIIDSGEAGEKAHTYILGGNTCMTG